MSAAWRKDAGEAPVVGAYTAAGGACVMWWRRRASLRRHDARSRVIDGMLHHVMAGSIVASYLGD